MIEAVLLTGGSSSRMGFDKASIAVDGVPLGQRIATELSRVATRVTVLGRSPIPGWEFLADEEQYAGPLAALARFQPAEELVFVASCDVPLFEHGVVEDLAAAIGGRQAAIPVDQDRPQPLCALYRADAFEEAKALAAAGERRVMAWVGTLDTARVPAAGLRNPMAVRNVNTLSELEAMDLSTTPSES